LLHLFMRHPDEVIDRARLHEDVWGYTFDPGTNIADVFVGYLRRKLEADEDTRVLHTVRGIGFILRI
jgi:DNA-binding response OmpR family regulator